jgi:inner membrane protein
MDSLTQFALGAAVSAFCLGSKLGPRKAAILGGAIGTLPDLDVFLPFDDPVDSFVMHRGWTHSVVIHAMAAPILGEVLLRVFGTLKDHRFLVWLTVFLCLSTHAAIDAMTVYGTRLFWPVHPDPVGVGSIFIIDPLYTLPLLMVVVWALARRSWSPRLGKGLTLALLLTTTYLGLGVAFQANAEKRAKVIFADAGIEAKRVFAIAAPFNTVVWRVIGLEDDRYHNLYLSIFDDDQNARIYTHQRRADLVACLNEVAAFKKLEWFTRGYYRSELRRNQIVVSDLRMGLTPNYVFSFAIAEQNGQLIQSIPPERTSQRPNEIAQDLEWLDERFFGRPAIRAAEQEDQGPVSEGERTTC